MVEVPLRVLIFGVPATSGERWIAWLMEGDSGTVIEDVCEDAM